MRRAIVAALAIMAAGAGAQQVREVETRIVAATVFPQQVLVTREGTVSLGTGEYELSFAGLPGSLNTESVRITGEGSASVRLSGVEVKREFLEAAQNPRVAVLEDSVRVLRDEDALLDGKAALLDSMARFYSSIQASAAADASRQLAERRPSPVDWRGAAEFVYAGLINVLNEKQQIALRRRTIGQYVERLEKQLAELRGPSAAETYRAVAGLASARGGSLTVRLSYLMPNAGWSMRYRATMTEESAVELEALGQVYNRTGEDWNDVSLTLSTAQPSRGVAVPDIGSWVLSAYYPVYEREYSGRRAAEDRMGMGFGAMLGEAAPAAPPEVAQAATMFVEQQGAVVNFSVPGLVEVPSDGSVHTKTITTKTFAQPKTEYVCVPRVAEAVYAVATMTNGSDYPLLAGSVEVFDRSTFLGTAYLGNVAPGQEFTLPMGIDDRVQVKFGLVSKKEETSGKKTQVHYVYHTVLTAFTPAPLEVTVRDHVPVSSTDEIKVKDVRLSPPAAKQRDDGVCEWALRLSPRQATEVTVEFTVEYPTGMSVQGLF